MASKCPYCQKDASFGVTTQVAVSEKSDMQSLNNRLAQYIDKMKEVKFASMKGMDTSMYHESIKKLEMEIASLRTMYDGQLRQLRAALEAATGQKNGLVASNQHLQKNVESLQIRLDSELCKSGKYEGEIKQLTGVIASLEKQIADLKIRMSQRHAEAENPELARLRMEHENVKKALCVETKARHDAEEKLRQLMEKSTFDVKVANKTQYDLNERIKAANDIIAALEVKLKQLNRMGDNLPAILKRLRDGNVADLRKYQMETEAVLNKHMDAMKSQMCGEMKAREEMAAARSSMSAEVAGLKKANFELMAEVKSWKAACAAMQQELEAERARSASCIGDMEQRLKHLTFHLMNHTKEFVHARDAQMSLKAEIDTYGALLEAERMRLKTPASRPGTNCSMRRARSEYALGGNTQRCQVSGTPRLQTPLRTPRPPTRLPSRSGSMQSTYNSDFVMKKQSYCGRY